jgi:hypothetical protein
LYAPLLAHLSVTRPAHLILLNLIARTILVRSTGHKFSLYLVFSIPVLLVPLGPNLFLSTLFSCVPSTARKT